MKVHREVIALLSIKGELPRRALRALTAEMAPLNYEAMLRLIVILALWLGAPTTVAVAQSPCPRSDSCHGGGSMAMSPDGAFVAFTLMGAPSGEFVLLDVKTKRSSIVRAPAAHTLNDLAWSPDGDDLTFVTGPGSVLGGEGSSIWRLSPNHSKPLVLLGTILGVRRPTLSADGKTLAAFERVVLDDPPYVTTTQVAYALFERTLADGRALRRSEGQMMFAPLLSYDRGGSLFLGGMIDPVFVQSFSTADGRVRHYWGGGDVNNRWSWQWRREINNVGAFRLAPREILPTWPKPFPVSGAIMGAQGRRPTADGRVIALVSLSNESASDWYDERGMPRRPSRQLLHGYVAYDSRGAGEQFSSPSLPPGVGRTGGADISEDGSRFAQVISRNLRTGVRPANEIWDNEDMIELYDFGKLTYERRVAELIKTAQKIQASDSDRPITPIEITTPHHAIVQ